MEDNSPKPKAKVMKEGWDPDEFPTSARPIFRALGLLVAIIVGLCLIVFYTSDFEEEVTTQPGTTLDGAAADPDLDEEY